MVRKSRKKIKCHTPSSENIRSAVYSIRWALDKESLWWWSSPLSLSDPFFPSLLTNKSLSVLRSIFRGRVSEDHTLANNDTLPARWLLHFHSGSRNTFGVSGNSVPGTLKHWNCSTTPHSASRRNYCHDVACFTTYFQACFSSRRMLRQWQIKCLQINDARYQCWRRCGRFHEPTPRNASTTEFLSWRCSPQRYCFEVT